MSRRTALYFSWDAKKECAAALGVLDNRFPALFELRRAAWPHFAELADPARFDQGLPGFLQHVVLGDFQRFSDAVMAATGHPLTRVERVAVADHLAATSQPQLLDDALLGSHDTVIIVSLDHCTTDQLPSESELAAVRRFLARPGTRLIVCPHHDVGASADPAERQQEHTHHGDALVPAEQRLGGFAHALLAGLGLPIRARFGLRPAVLPDGSPAPLALDPSLDALGLLRGVTTFNAHGHLPHLAVPDELRGQVHVLARQLIAADAPPHPHTQSGQRTFDALLWAPPSGERAGEVIVGDATLFSAAFGGLPSLRKLWQNLI